MSLYWGDIIEVYWRVGCIAGYRVFGRLDGRAASGPGLLNGVSGTVWCHTIIKIVCLCFSFNMARGVPVRTVTEVQAGGQLARIYSYSATAQQACAFLTSEPSALRRSAFGSFRVAARLCEAKLSTLKHCEILCAQ